MLAAAGAHWNRSLTGSYVQTVFAAAKEPPGEQGSMDKMGAVNNTAVRMTIFA